ncbi:MAG: hypothetical protein QXL14_02265 [Candidatus Aenigmatarchaeota archaeon]
MRYIKGRCVGLNNPNDPFEFFAISLFEKFYKSLKLEVLIFKKFIPYAYVWSFFSFYKINRQDAKKILKIWVDRRLCEYVKFAGIRINEKIVNEVLKSMVNNTTSEGVEENESK